MLIHLGYECPLGFCDTRVSLCLQLMLNVRLLYIRSKGAFPRRPVVDNVDGNSMRMVRSNFSNERGTAQSTQEDPCAESEEFVGVRLEVNKTIEASGERETLRASSSRPQR